MPGQHARRPHVGVLVEALADRQPQSPERHVIGHVRRADCAEEDRVERLELLEPALGDVVAVLQVVVAAPRKVLDLQPEAAVAAGEHLEHFQAGRDDLDADAVAGNRGDAVSRTGTVGENPIVTAHRLTPRCKIRTTRSRLRAVD